MKKLLISAISCFFSLSAHATPISQPINVTIQSFGNTPSNYHYCLDIFVGYDTESGCGIPVRLGSDFINHYLRGIKGSNDYHIKFAYSAAQPNGQWPMNQNKTCHFILNKDASLIVNITKTGCTITEN